jgi:hypothetical protein
MPAADALEGVSVIVTPTRPENVGTGTVQRIKAEMAA